MHKLLGAAVMAALLFGAKAARADDHDHDGDRVQRSGRQASWDRGWRGGPPQDRDERWRRWGPRGRDGGRYELRTVRVWVPESAQQVWVQGGCRPTAWGPRCWPAGYQTRMVPAHFEDRQDWVWVRGGR